MDSLIPPRPIHRLCVLLLVLWGLGCLLPGSVQAISITGYSSEVNDRFASGFPTAPVDNTAPSFIGLGLDWDGVGWATGDATKGFGFLSPQHYMVAKHYGGSANLQVSLDGTLETGTQNGVEDTGYGVVFGNATVGDLSLGTLIASLPMTMPRYAVLDLNSSSTTNSPGAYVGLEVLLYGRGPSAAFSPRIGQANLLGVTVSGNNTYFTTNRTAVQLEVGDSGSPAFHRWTNPNGTQELTLLGNHAAIDTSNNYINFLGTSQVMGQLNSFMNDDGFALRVVGNPTNTWVGNSSTNINNRASWGLSFPTPAPSDLFVNFNAATAGSGRLVTVNTNHNLRGLYFLFTSAASDGFSFNGTSTLTIGRGGVTNYDNSRQVFNAPLKLGDSQYWDGGSGGITVGALDTNGRLLEITGQGTNRITGVISGSGGLAVSGGVLELTSNNTYSGRTWVHAGTLLLSNPSGSATGSGNVTVASSAILSGNGTIAGPVRIRGSLQPGSSALETFTVQNNLTWDAGTPWVFQLGSAAPSLSGAASGGSTQDALAITSGDFLRGSGATGDWTFDFLGTGLVGWYRLITWSGSSTFAVGDFSLVNLNPGYTGSFSLQSQGLYLQVAAPIPEPSTSLLLLLAAGCFAGYARQRARGVQRRNSAA